VARPGMTLVAASIVLAAGAVSAADDVVARALRLYEQHHYEEAAQTLQAGLPTLNPAGRASAYLTLGMIYLGNAELHRELYETAITVQLDYLKKLVAVRGAEGSRFANLYLGKALLESGEAREAAKYLERFSAQPGISSRYRAIAGASLGLSHFVGNNAQAARAQWANVDTADPEVQMALAAAYSRAGLKDRDPAAMGEAALRKAGASPSPRLLEGLLTIYARAGLTDRGLELVRQADLKEASYTEALGQTKAIRFYDVTALGDLAALYRRASVQYLERATTDAQLKPAADYYLGVAYAEAGEVERSQRAFSTFLTLPTTVPPPQRNRARVRYATGQYLQGQRGEAMAVWDGLAQEQSADPELLAEILSACARVRAGCAGVESRAARVSEAGEGRKTRALNIALGRLYLRRGDYGQAITYLEAGRDKSRKNRIESNDPLMLVNLADAYYRGRQFSEGLEIYFEMSKHYPVVRRIQDAMQGMYAVEQKSAGDVKIF
jgi:tetratricopeptide (TPR) repeat protein